MTKVTIDKVFSDAKETKFGKRTQLSIKVKESTVKDINGVDIKVDGKYIRGFFPEGFVAPFKDGEQAEILVLQKGEFLNFSLPGVGKPPAPDVGVLLERIATLEGQMKVVLNHLQLKAVKTEEPEVDSVDPDDF